LQDLTEKNILTPRGEGRNRCYDLNLVWIWMWKVLEVKL
jgi:hypothetical protein